MTDQFATAVALGRAELRPQVNIAPRRGRFARRERRLFE